MLYPKGIYAAMMTPFTAEGAVNEVELRRIVDFLIDRGVDGLFPLGSVGEAVHLSRDEKFRIMETVADQARGRVQVIPGAGTTHPAQSIELAKRAGELGCDGVVVAPPHYYSLSQDMMETYFERIADEGGLPVILYNIPLFSQAIGYDVVKRLSRRPNIVGLKDSSGSMVDFMHFMDKVRVIGEHMSFMVGREDILFPSLMVGGKGCMTATGGILPEALVDIYQAWKAGDHERARERQFSILLLMRAMFMLPFPLGFKTALEMRGFSMGPPKQPLSNAEYFKYRVGKARIEKIMQPFLEEFGGADKAKAV